MSWWNSIKNKREYLCVKVEAHNTTTLETARVNNNKKPLLPKLANFLIDLN